MQCAACNKVIDRGELLVCTSCRGFYDYKCLNMTQDYYTSHAHELRRNWTCPVCSNITRRKHDNTPVRNQFDILREDANMSCDYLSDIPDGDSKASTSQSPLQTPRNNTGSLVNPSGTSGSISYEQFSLLLDSKLESIRAALTADIKKEIASAIDSLRDDFTRTTDFLAAEQKDLNVRLVSVKDTIQSLESENIKLRSDITDLTRRMQTLEKISRSRNIEIHCVPERKNENLITIFKNLCNEIKVSIPDTDLQAIRRVAKMNNASDRPINVLATLPSERHRNNLLSAITQYNKSNKNSVLNSSHLGVPGEKRTIYLAEHLSPECKKLHAATKLAAKERSYKFVWVKYGRIYVRKTEQDQAIQIKHISCLAKLT